MRVKLRIAALLIIFSMMFSVLTLNASALTVSGQFHNPVGDGSFESGAQGWSYPQGSQSSSYAYLGTYSWWTQPYSGDYVMSYQLGDSVVSTIAGRKVIFSFWYYPASVASDGSLNQMRAEITYNYYTCSSLCPVSPQPASPSPSRQSSSARLVPLGPVYHTATAAGAWVAPTRGQWYNAWVTVELPADDTVTGRTWLNWVKVQVHGHNGGSEYIDNAWFQIIDSSQTTNQNAGATGCWTLGLSAALSDYTTQQATPPGVVRMSVASSVIMKPNQGACTTNAYLGYIKLTVTMINGCATSSDLCQLFINYASQTNNLNEQVSPAANAQRQATGLELAGYILGLVIAGGIAIATDGISLPLSQNIILGVGQTIGGGAVTTALQVLYTSPDQTSAHGPGTSDGASIWEKWDHTCPSCGLVNNATGQYSFTGFFYPSQTSFQVNISAEAGFVACGYTCAWYTMSTALTTTISG